MTRTNKSIKPKPDYVVELPEGLRIEGRRISGGAEALRSLRGLLGRKLQGDAPTNKVPDNQRCPCRLYSKWLAAKRGHRCQKPKEAA